MDMIDNPMHNKATPKKNTKIFTDWHVNMLAIPPVIRDKEAKAKNVWQMFLGK